MHAQSCWCLRDPGCTGKCMNTFAPLKRNRLLEAMVRQRLNAAAESTNKSPDDTPDKGDASTTSDFDSRDGLGSDEGTGQSTGSNASSPSTTFDPKRQQWDSFGGGGQHERYRLKMWEAGRFAELVNEVVIEGESGVAGRKPDEWGEMGKYLAAWQVHTIQWCLMARYVRQLDFSTGRGQSGPL
jgi:hypothetical protein